MSLNLDEIRSIRLPQALRGYARAAVDELVAGLTDAIEQLQEGIGRLEVELAHERQERGRSERELAATSAAHVELERRLQQATTEREQLARAVDEATREREEFVAAIEEVKNEREARASYTERLEQELARYRDLEQSLTGAIVAAERSGSDTRAQADREARLIIDQARADARKITFAASSERERLLADVQRIRSMLASAQAALDEGAAGPDAPAPRTVDADETSFGSRR